MNKGTINKKLNQFLDSFTGKEVSLTEAFFFYIKDKIPRGDDSFEIKVFKASPNINYSVHSFGFKTIGEGNKFNLTLDSMSLKASFKFEDVSEESDFVCARIDIPIGDILGKKDFSFILDLYEETFDGGEKSVKFLWQYCDGKIKEIAPLFDLDPKEIAELNIGQGKWTTEEKVSLIFLSDFLLCRNLSIDLSDTMAAQMFEELMEKLPGFKELVKAIESKAIMTVQVA